MSNGIAERQNKEVNIARLAAQRQLYSEVGRINKSTLVLTVIIPIILTVLQEFPIPGSYIKTVAGVFSLAMLVISFILKDLGKRKRELAASIQQEFDVDVFQMPWDEKLFGERKNYNSEIAEASKKILGKEEKKSKLLNWYVVGVDALPINEGIAACQKENFNWDAGIRKRYRSLVCFLLTAIIVVPIIAGAFRGWLVTDLIFRWVLVSPAIKWCIENIVDLTNDLDRMHRVENKVYSTEAKDMLLLQVTQKEIFENRKLVVKIPDWFYLKFRDNDEDRERKAIELGTLP